LALGGGARQAAVLDAPPVALGPSLRGDLTQPVRRHRGEFVERRAQGLAHQLQAVEHPDGGQDVSGVGALPAARLEQAARPAHLEQLAQEPLLGATREQAGAELAQHRGVEAGIGQLQPEQVLPVDPRPHRLGRLPIGQVLVELQQGDQGQPPRRQARLAAPGEQVGEIRVGEDRAELVTELQEQVALAEGGAGDARRLLRHRLKRAGLERHGGASEWQTEPTYRSPSEFASSIGPPF
jgi:hypothetical protein